uniref:Uncharacterized protein n=1 Tax=Hucho hucho TaxID=62062 RepID=A0A4W5P3G6_9TELE
SGDILTTFCLQYNIYNISLSHFKIRDLESGSLINNWKHNSLRLYYLQQFTNTLHTNLVCGGQQGSELLRQIENRNTCEHIYSLPDLEADMGEYTRTCMHTRDATVHSMLSNRSVRPLRFNTHT